MTTITQSFLKGYVDPQTRTVSREVYVNEEIYQIEQERVFARVWLFLGH